jgi:hypothetical protein
MSDEAATCGGIVIKVIKKIDEVYIVVTLFLGRLSDFIVQKPESSGFAECFPLKKPRNRP